MSVLVTEEESEVFRDYVQYMDMDKRVRPLSPKELVDATNVFGDSVDYVRVMISNASGLGGRAFCELSYFKVTVVRDDVETRYKIPFNIINLAGGWGKDYPRRLHHEMTHVWQSQHALDPHAYFWNSMKNQAAAVMRHLEYEDYHQVYEYKSGLGFGWYNAEQIARGVATHKDAMLINHIRSIKKNTRDTVNEQSLSVVNAGKALPVEQNLYQI